MNSKGDVTISNKAPSADTKSRSPVPAKEKLDGEEKPDRSTKSRIRRTPHSQLGLTRYAKSASPARNYCPQSRRAEPSPSPGKGRPREFLTGLDYRTKFMREIRNEKTPVGTGQNRTRRPTSVHVGVNSRSVKPASNAVECAPVRRTRVARSLTASEERPREFLTGVDYRTKFMRKSSYDTASLKSRHNSGDSKNAHQTKVDARKTNQGRQLKSKTSLLRFPLREGGVKKPTEVNLNLTQTVPNRKMSQLSTSTADTYIRTPHATATSGAKVKGCQGKKPPFGAQKTPAATKAGTTPLRQSRTKSNATKADVCLLQSGEAAENGKTSGSNRLSPALEQARNSFDLSIFDNFMQGINRVDLSIKIPSSPISEPTGSNSLHTTPRSPRIGQKNFANSFLRLPISETSSLQSEHSLPLSETLEMQRASSPLAKVSWPSKAHSHSKKCKYLPISDNTLVYRSLGSFTNARRSKATDIKQEPISFNAQFVPVVKWTSKTNSDDLFEPLYRQGLSSLPNSRNSNTTPADIDNASNKKTAKGELSKQPAKETANTNYDIALDECYMKRQQTAANEHYDILHPRLMHRPMSANVRSTNKKSTTQDDTLSKKADRSHAKNRMNPAKPAWKLTGSQQIASGCSLWSSTPSPLLKRSHESWKLAESQQVVSGRSLWSPTPSPLLNRSHESCEPTGSQQVVSGSPRRSPTPSPLLKSPQSVKNIATTNKLPEVYTMSTKWPVGDFAMRPRSVAVNKKPVWK